MDSQFVNKTENCINLIFCVDKKNYINYFIGLKKDLNKKYKIVEGNLYYLEL